MAQDLNLPFDSKGIVVTNVAAGSPADAMGLQKGDIIVSLDGRAITDVATFKSAGLDARRMAGRLCCSATGR